MRRIAYFSICAILITSQNVIAQRYFQQIVNYNIDVSLNDRKHVLSGFEEIEYINKSRDTLHYIYFHLWPNAFKNNQTALAKQLVENGSTNLLYAERNDRGYIDSLYFKVDGEKTEWFYDENHIDIAKVILNSALLPEDTIKITTPFKVKIPVAIYSRLGHLGESYQITQWYPKPAVYDKNGWHPMPYLDQGEFYSEFGSFDVKITLPKNYVVGATGDLINGIKELNWLNKKVKQTEEKINEGYFNSWKKDAMKIPPSSDTLKTLHFHQEKVHDFAWFADKRFNVLKGSVKLPYSQDSVTTWAMFTNNEADIWTKSITYLNDAIYYYSLWNGNYPYNHATAVDGINGAGTDMEYPNITVVGEGYDAIGLDDVIAHEVGHNWFYGILGSNERDHPWMDEGLNSFNEFRYMELKYPKLNIMYDTIPSALTNFGDINKYKYKYTNYLGYLINERTNFDQPIEFHSKDYTYANYGLIVYGKSAAMLDYLMAYLGEELFDTCMQTYYEQWKFKHPQAEDLQRVFEDITNKNLDWFFQDIIKTTKSIDYKIAKQDGNNFTILNKGEISSPFSLSSMKGDSIISTKWFDGFPKDGIIEFETGEASKIKIDATNKIPEYNRNNNNIKTKGVFKKIEPLKVQLIGSIDHPDKTQLFVSPIIGFNTTDAFMIGAAFYNSILPQNNFEYILAPMYSIGSNTLVGSGQLKYNYLPKGNTLRQVSYSLSGSSHSYQSLLGIKKPYYKMVPEIKFHVAKQRARSPSSHTISIKGIGINEPEYLAYSLSDYLDKVNNNNSVTNIYGLVNYSFAHKATLKQFFSDITMEINEEFAKISMEAKLDIPFKNENKGFHARLFAGSFVFNNTTNPRFNYRMDGSNGFYDYKYDFIHLDRSTLSNGLSKQLIQDQGGFITPVNNSSNRWMISLNLKSELPFPLPLGIFANIGTNGTNELMYDAGIYIFIIRNYVEFYMPLVYSQNIKNTLGSKRPFELIRFTLNLNNANPFKLIKEFEL